MTSPLRRLPEVIVDRFGDRLGAIDTLATPFGERLGPGRLKDVLSGTWLGHPLHPVLTDVAIGSWSSAFILDLFGGERSARAARTLTGVGVLAAVPTAVTGFSDWSDVEGEDRRVGVAHAVGNLAATAAYAGSWLARRRGRRAAGVALGLLGGGIASATAYLGGHLVFGRGVGVDVTAFDAIPRQWIAVMDAAELQTHTPTLVDVRGVPVMLLRRGTDVTAMHDRCTHRGGPLHRGTVDEDAGTVTCPWHGSCFRLTDGELVRGPATAPQPTYEARIADGKVEVRRPPALQTPEAPAPGAS
jgi:nitrite reductase/ring-hydroxylating ferredoxin subunit/uncharacterized membrane protein